MSFSSFRCAVGAHHCRAAAAARMGQPRVVCVTVITERKVFHAQDRLTVWQNTSAGLSPPLRPSPRRQAHTLLPPDLTAQTYRRNNDGFSRYTGHSHQTVSHFSFLSHFDSRHWPALRRCPPRATGRLTNLRGGRLSQPAGIFPCRAPRVISYGSRPRRTLFRSRAHAPSC